MSRTGQGHFVTPNSKSKKLMQPVRLSFFIDECAMNLSDAPRNAKRLYDSVVFYEKTWSMLCKKWPEGKRKHWQKKRISQYEMYLKYVMEDFEEVEKVLEDARINAGISLIDGQFVYSKIHKLSATDHGLKISAADQQAIQEWLLFKDSIIRK